jgi:hypothetical protein
MSDAATGSDIPNQLAATQVEDQRAEIEFGWRIEATLFD